MVLVARSLITATPRNHCRSPPPWSAYFSCECRGVGILNRSPCLLVTSYNQSRLYLTQVSRFVEFVGIHPHAVEDFSGLGVSVRAFREGVHLLVACHVAVHSVVILFPQRMVPHPLIVRWCWREIFSVIFSIRSRTYVASLEDLRVMGILSCGDCTQRRLVSLHLASSPRA